MRLNDAQVGDVVMIKNILDPVIQTMALRMGFPPGEWLTLCAKIPGGPLVIRCGDAEIALGQEICQGIEVALQ